MKVKSLIVAGLLVLFAIIVMAATLNGIDVPLAVKNTFSQKYPSAQDVEWELEETDVYEAEFKLDNVRMSSCFKKDGTWTGTETEINSDDLPPAVKKNIAANFSDYEVEEAERCERPEGDIVWEVELENEDVELEVVFSTDGKILEKEIKKEDDEEDNN